MALSTLMWILASATTPLFSAGGTPYVLINSTNAPNNLQIDQNRSVRITVKPRTGADFECHLIGSTGRVDLDVASCDIFKGSGVLPNIKTNRRGVAEYVVFWTNYPSASKNKAITIGGERYIYRTLISLDIRKTGHCTVATGFMCERMERSEAAARSKQAAQMSLMQTFAEC